MIYASLTAYGEQGPERDRKGFDQLAYGDPAVVRRLSPAAVQPFPYDLLVLLLAVAGLKKGRSEARETDPVKPVSEEFVQMIKPHVSRQVWAIVELQLLSGMRSGEVVLKGSKVTAN